MRVIIHSAARLQTFIPTLQCMLMPTDHSILFLFVFFKHDNTSDSAEYMNTKKFGIFMTTTNVFWQLHILLYVCVCVHTFVRECVRACECVYAYLRQQRKGVYFCVDFLVEKKNEKIVFPNIIAKHMVFIADKNPICR